MENKVTYPMLSDAEIVECFKELGVQQLTVQNLSKPEPEFIYALYENVVQKLMGITGEEMSKPVFEPYNQLEHPHLYDAAIYQITFIGNLYVVPDILFYHICSLFFPKPRLCPTSETSLKI
jgi:hypothetical protein